MSPKVSTNMAAYVIFFLRVAGSPSRLSVVVPTVITFGNTRVLPVYPVNVLQFTLGLVYVIES